MSLPRSLLSALCSLVPLVLAAADAAAAPSPESAGLGLEALQERLRQDLSNHSPLGFDPSDDSELTLHPAR